MPPSNDNFANATTILGTTFGTIFGTTIGATYESGEPTDPVYGDSTPHSVWYKFTLSATDVYHFNISTWHSGEQAGTLFSGTSLGSLTHIADLQVFNLAINGATLTAGTYYIRVYPRLLSSVRREGTFYLQWSNDDIPANDDFANAQTISGTSGSLDSFIGGATFESGEPNHTNAGTSDIPNFRTVWYKMNASSTRTQGFDVLDNSGQFDTTTVQVYTGSAVNALTLVSQQTIAGSRWYTTVTVNMTSGTDYYICIAWNPYGGTSTAPRPFTLTWGLPPTNDNWASAATVGQVLGGGTVTSYNSTTKAEIGNINLPTNWKYCTLETNDPDRGSGSSPPGYSTRTIWYKWQSQAKGILRILSFEPVVDRSLLYKTVGVWQGSSLASLTRINYTEFSNTDIPATLIGQLDAPVEAGQLYYIELGDDDEVPTPESPNLTWEFIPDSLWTGVWGNPPLPTPEPGTIPGGSKSWTTIWKEFRGTVLPALPGYLGTPYQWYTMSDNDFESVLTPDGLRQEQPLTPAHPYGDVANSYSGTVARPSGDIEWQVGFFVEGLKWISTSNDGGAGGHAETTNYMFQLGGWSIQVYNRSPMVFPRLASSGSFQGSWAIANGRKYRLKYTYESSLNRSRCYLISYPGDSGVLFAELVGSTPSTTWSAGSPYNTDIWAAERNIDGTSWSITYEGWSAPVLPKDFYYYKGAAWHYLGAETNQDVFVFKGGTWQRA